MFLLNMVVFNLRLQRYRFKEQLGGNLKIGDFDNSLGIVKGKIMNFIFKNFSKKTASPIA
ncbi:hypothetical protein JCM19314_574 [Nonlabens ulvanivorans]|uniref:Uncharacterized protein n=1 Tax=Nonlabens ulvanivorans TaxID=906888 RepID=A0A090R2S0_NONUL|nr:hypothetical protein JCM19314_574 [Nonlabens ulvanivorans]